MRKLLAVMLSLILLFSMAAPVFADGIVGIDPAKQIADKLETVQADLNMDDCTKIKTVITLLFDAKGSQYTKPTSEDFDFSIFWLADTPHSDNLNYFERCVKVQKEIYAVLDSYTANARTEIAYNDISIGKNTATVKLYAWFEYTYYSAKTGLSDYESGNGMPYTITLKKVDGEWLISDIDFVNNETKYLRDEDVDIEAVVAAAHRRATEVEPSILLQGSENANIENGRSASVYLLNTSRFVEYALLYDGSARNPNFEDISNNGGDCQNFASQCLWYGFGGTNTSAAINALAAPMVSPSVTSIEERQWYCSIPAGHSPSWTGVGDFRDHVTAPNSGYYGLNGYVYSGIANAQPGDIIQISKDGGNTWYHTYVVVAVTGSVGSRTASNITISAHTCDRAAQLLSSIGLSDDHSFRTIRIVGVRCG